MSGGFEDDFEEMPDPASASPSAGSSAGSSPSTSTTLPSTLAFDDLCSYAPSRCCIYLPCKTMWPNASVDDRLPPMPLLDANGTQSKTPMARW